MKKGLRLAVLALALLGAVSATAQENNTTIELQARISENIATPSNDALSGLNADYLNLAVSGSINDKLSVSWRQRFNKAITAENPLRATDMLYIAYQPDANWSFTFGQQTLSIGGWEYDSAPINIYFASEFWNNIACYQIGAKTAYTTDKGNNTFLLQVNRSPFDTPATNLLGYDLMWYGNFGPYSAAHSINIYEYRPNQYIYYLALGNRLTFGDITLELDAMCRTTGESEIFDSVSVMGGLKWKTGDKLNLLLRATYDNNQSTIQPFDSMVFAGTELTQIGGGVEYFPFNSRDLRLHAIWSAVSGTNSNPDGVLTDGAGMLKVGATWYLKIK
ncbi:MAG: hypothetical protein J6Q40_03115 [Tidjanibacter sp.]|nr:hypothetical protein [Tidjanibacter sp.]